MDELLAYQTFSLKSEATEVAEKLRKAGIVTEIAEKATGLGGVFVGSNYEDGYILRIAATDFPTANALLYAHTEIDVANIDPDHPLNAMSIDELKDIVAKPDEWGADNFNTAMALLKGRNITISGRTIAKMQEKRIAVLSEKKRLNPWIIFIGYSTALSPVIANIYGRHDYHALSDIQGISGLSDIPASYFVWYFPGIAGLFLGLFILAAKTTLPDGRRIMTYDNATIKQGIIITILNILSWLVNIFIVLYKMF